MSTKRPRTATPLAHAMVPTPLGAAHLFSTTRGLLTIALPDEPCEAAVALAERLLGPIAFSEDGTILREAAAQLAAYFAGTLHTFTLTYDLHGRRSSRPSGGPRWRSPTARRALTAPSRRKSVAPARRGRSGRRMPRTRWPR